MMLMFGLVSSIHCAGMCGPLVAVATAQAADVREKSPGFKPFALWQFLYQAGRGISYFLAGALIASAGGSLVEAVPLKYAGDAAQISIGAIFLIIAFLQIFKKSGVGEVKSSLTGKLIGRLIAADRAYGIFSLGLISGILPCGVLFAAYLYASSAGGALDGGLYMLLFWAGTAPALAATALFSHGLLKTGGKYSKYIPN